MTNQAKMVDIGAKPITDRRATAQGLLRLRSATIKKIRDKSIEKGDVLEIARTAAIMAAKNTPQLLPLCHPIPLDAVDVDLKLETDAVRATVTVRAHWRTGVEMEALAATTIALLTAWDLVKPYEKDKDGQYPATRLGDVRVIEKVKR